MTEVATTTITDKEKVTIYLAEYATLRSEVISRISTRWNFVGITIGVLVFLCNQQTWQTRTLVFSTVLSAVPLTYTWWRSWYFILKCANRVPEIEAAVNALAGEKILDWETNKDISRSQHQLIGRFLGLE